MLDTINNWLSTERAGVSNLLAHVEPYLEHISEHKDEFGQTYITGMLGSNYKAAVALQSIYYLTISKLLRVQTARELLKRCQMSFICQLTKQKSAGSIWHKIS